IPATSRAARLLSIQVRMASSPDDPYRPCPRGPAGRPACFVACEGRHMPKRKAVVQSSFSHVGRLRLTCPTGEPILKGALGNSRDMERKASGELGMHPYAK